MFQSVGAPQGGEAEAEAEPAQHVLFFFGQRFGVANQFVYLFGLRQADAVFAQALGAEQAVGSQVVQGYPLVGVYAGVEPAVL